MKVRCVKVGPIQTNCYIVEDDGRGKKPFCAVIDPGDDAQFITGLLDREPSHIIITHCHFDHIGAVDALVNSYHCPVYACKDDEDILVEGKIALHENNGLFVRNKINWLTSENLKIGKFDIRVIFTPGHTSGSVMFVIDDVLFSGDTLFLESVGRTDLYSGSYSQLKQSLKILNDLSLDMVVYPGHDGKTTVGHELQFNPFL